MCVKELWIGGGDVVAVELVLDVFDPFQGSFWVSCHCVYFLVKVVHMVFASSIFSDTSFLASLHLLYFILMEMLLYILVSWRSLCLTLIEGIRKSLLLFNHPLLGSLVVAAIFLAMSIVDLVNDA